MPRRLTPEKDGPLFAAFKRKFQCLSILKIHYNENNNLRASEQYLQNNPDVAEAVNDPDNPIQSAEQHFVNYGQDEGRKWPGEQPIKLFPYKGLSHSHNDNMACKLDCIVSQQKLSHSEHSKGEATLTDFLIALRPIEMTSKLG